MTSNSAKRRQRIKEQSKEVADYLQQMTDNIYPPDHLLRKWESLIIDEDQNVDVVLYEAFQAGADQELEACCGWIESQSELGKRSFTTEARVKFRCEVSDRLRAARRPKSPSLKEQALAALMNADGPDYPVPTLVLHVDDATIIRRALESLPD